MTRFGFIGTGSMGSMLIRQFILSGAIRAEDITACSRKGESARNISEETGIAIRTSPQEVAEAADVIFICVHPMDVRDVTREIHNSLTKGKLLISVASCVTLNNLSTWAGPAVHCARVLPSITAEEHAGISLVAWGSWATEEDKQLILSLFSAIGTPVEVEEKHFEIYGDLTSCAPAFISAMMQEFARAAVKKEGVPLPLAEFLVQQTLIGTAWLVDREDTGFDDIISRVATKGGITEEGVNVIRDRIPAMFDEVMKVTLAKHELIKQLIAKES